ncbi:MAG: Mov34/MPN/PAD-1 family protein [Candidatus Lokiarchaeota archaeon]|nr:Mov34/MPN/PAD-1 family protein [Candidatus Lokiarchaeota archaeon]
MTILEDQFQKIIEVFPNALTVNNLISHIKIPLQNSVFLVINFKNYPKKPKISLINMSGQIFGNLEMMISSLRTWKKKNHIEIIELIFEIQKLIKNLLANEVLVKRELMQGILGLCNDQHPREILGMLRMEKCIISEFILPPGALRSTNNTLFSPSRIPMDPSIVGTVHSHPSGNPTPSGADIRLFKKGYVHFIVGYPYKNDTIKCYDQNGNMYNFKLVD